MTIKIFSLIIVFAIGYIIDTYIVIYIFYFFTLFFSSYLAYLIIFERINGEFLLFFGILSLLRVIAGANFYQDLTKLLLYTNISSFIIIFIGNKKNLNKIVFWLLLGISIFYNIYHSLSLAYGFEFRGAFSYYWNIKFYVDFLLICLILLNDKNFKFYLNHNINVGLLTNTKHLDRNT